MPFLIHVPIATDELQPLAAPPFLQMIKISKCCLNVLTNNVERLLLGYYDKEKHGTGWRWKFLRTSIGTVQGHQFSDNINSVSPLFVEIFNQANYAEGHGLHDIAGIGYRKAFEFLIKDYLSKKFPTETEVIQKKFLGNCIKDHLDDAKIKDMAERAVWIGNDETHYIRKWNDKDISDLKRLILRFIGLTLKWTRNDIERKCLKIQILV